MLQNPDIVQAFSNYTELVRTSIHHPGIQLIVEIQVAYDYASVFYQLPVEHFSALIRCAVTALSLQERYSLVSACSFLVSPLLDVISWK